MKDRALAMPNGLMAGKSPSASIDSIDSISIHRICWLSITALTHALMTSFNSRPFSSCNQSQKHTIITSVPLCDCTYSKSMQVGQTRAFHHLLAFSA
jgi:hypothetical protein